MLKYNGRLTLRIRPKNDSVIESNIEKPYEIHLVEFDTEEDFENFKKDEERKQFLHLKEASIKSSILRGFYQIVNTDKRNKTIKVIHLNQNNAELIAQQIPYPKYDRQALKTGIVHIGVGGFHRSHQAYYIHQLLTQYNTLDWGICGVGIREADRKMYDVLKKQDGLYTLIVQHPKNYFPNNYRGRL